MSKEQRWSAISFMILVLTVMFMVNPKAASSFALIILLIAIGYGVRNGKFSLGG